MSSLRQSAEYRHFRSNVPLKTIAVDENDPQKQWKLFDFGPREQKVPLVFIPPVSGAADCFYKQLLALEAKGFRVISAECPAAWTADEFCEAFKALLSHLGLEKVHLFGSALGGFLAQKFAESTRTCPRVASMILCNTFTDTSVFKYADQAQLFWVMPGPLLRNLVTAGLETASEDPTIVAAADFMAESLDGLGQSLLASRLSVNCAPNAVVDIDEDLAVTVIDVWDESALSDQVKEDVHKLYPKAKKAHLKTGGNFPFLSRAEEVNMHILIHMRNYAS